MHRLKSCLTVAGLAVAFVACARADSVLPDANRASGVIGVKSYANLRLWNAGFEVSEEKFLTRSQVEEDLAQLERELTDKYSYLKLRAVDYRSALAAVRAGASEKSSVSAFSVQVEKFMALFGDGHSRLGDVQRLPGRAPFLVGQAGDRYVAFLENREHFLDDAHPVLIAMDGVPLEKWLEAARRLRGGSLQFVERNACEELRSINFLRSEMGLPLKDSLQVELADLRGTKKVVRNLALAKRSPRFGDWPRRKSAVLDGGIGYLRIADMEPEPQFLEDLHARLKNFQGTHGLIIDVRGNGGGSRAVINELLPYFMAPDEAPRVVNAAFARLRTGQPANKPEGYLKNRFLYPAATWPWSDAEKMAIARFQAGLKLEWSPPPSGFSDMHVFVVPAQLPRGGHRYDRPVLVLMDSGCFSATDIFLGAFKGLRNATLLGTASGGGSGRTSSLVLQHSGLKISYSTMVSFQPDGRLYDGNGVQPDVVVTTVATDLIGETDSQLAAALTGLQSSR